MTISTRSISDYFDSARKSGSRHYWYLCKVVTGASTEDELAEWLAYRIVELRLSGCPQYFDSWRRRVEHGTALTHTEAKALRAFLASSFPNPLPPGLVDQLQGAVAEYLWYFIQVEGRNCDPAIYVEPPKGEVTDKGGDSITFHEDDNGEVTFRLWELKKHAPVRGGSVTSTASRACKQLEENGARYIAQFTAIGQKIDVDIRVASLCSDLPRHWIERTASAGAGVAIGTSHSYVSKRPFKRMGSKYLSDFPHSQSRQGIVSSLSDFAAFAESVRRLIWKGL